MFFRGVGLKHQAAMPASDKVSNVSFEDFDLDATDIGGNLTWALAENEANRPQRLRLVDAW